MCNVVNLLDIPISFEMYAYAMHMCRACDRRRLQTCLQEAQLILDSLTAALQHCATQRASANYITDRFGESSYLTAVPVVVHVVLKQQQQAWQ